MTDHQLAALEAWSTLIAAVAAIVAGVFAFLGWRKERESLARIITQEDERRDVAARAAQADKVAVWVEPLEGRYVLLDRDEVPDENLHHCYLRNASDLPVTNVSVEFWYEDTTLGNHLVDVLPPTTAPLEESVDEIYVENWLAAAKASWARYATSVIEPSPMTASIIFTDSAGRNWSRSTRGTLHQLPTGEPPRRNK